MILQCPPMKLRQQQYISVIFEIFHKGQFLIYILQIFTICSLIHLLLEKNKFRFIHVN